MNKTLNVGVQTEEAAAEGTTHLFYFFVHLLTFMYIKDSKEFVEM